ncbi:MAG: branched-chain amino acid aminotransferase [Actinomycetota bacterium]|nr:branched-chain amino acid aminotransferase [Actinomycetota bacterium]
MTTETVWLNGELVDDAHVSVMDHGLTVGDGVFETMLIRRGHPFARRRHLDRLERSLAGLGLRSCGRDIMEQACDEVVAASGRTDGRLRVTVTGGVGPMGSGRGDGPCTVLAVVIEQPPVAATAAVVTVPWTRNENSPLAGLKTTSYGENVVALARAKEAGADEAIFANTRGELCEGTGTNIAVVVDGRLVTPPLSSGCLAGITRELAIEHCGIEEATVPYSLLAEVTEAALLGTTRDVQPITSIDGRRLEPGAATLAARAAFLDLIATNLDP